MKFAEAMMVLAAATALPAATGETVRGVAHAPTETARALPAAPRLPTRADTKRLSQDD